MIHEERFCNLRDEHRRIAARYEAVRAEHKSTPWWRFLRRRRLKRELLAIFDESTTVFNKAMERYRPK